MRKMIIGALLFVGCAHAPSTDPAVVEKELEAELRDYVIAQQAGQRRQAEWAASTCVANERDLSDHKRCVKETVEYCLSHGMEADCAGGLWSGSR